MTAELDAVAEALTRVLGRPLGRDVPLSTCSTYRLGGPAVLFADVESSEELHGVAEVLAPESAPVDVPVLIVGRGSNLLVSEAGFPGLAIRLGGEFETIDVGDDGVVAGGAVPLPVLARRTASEARRGLEFYVGIPGSVGGAVRMNAGGHGRETAEVLRRAWLVDLARGPGERECSRHDLAFGYRRSSVSSSQIVVRAEFEVVADDPRACESRIAEVVRWRREHQPGGSNAGSVFTNPAGDSAGRLIDACGLKGLQVGGAFVSEKHANFFQATGAAPPHHLYRLIREVQARVADATGTHLVPELTLVGFAEDPA